MTRSCSGYRFGSSPQTRALKQVGSVRSTHKVCCPRIKWVANRLFEREEAVLYVMG
jgi:hypothetical protein